MSTNSLSSASLSNTQQDVKQFFLETARLEMVYQNLEDRFKAIQSTLQDSHVRVSGKLAELNFISRYLETILDHMTQGILFIDLQGIVTTYNSSAQNLLKIPESELLFHSVKDFFEDDFFGFSIQQTFLTKQSPLPTTISWNFNNQRLNVEIEAIFVQMNQQMYPLDQRSSITFDSTHASTPIQGLLILLRDVTKIRSLQQKANHHDRLQELGELAARIAHEIRNPLGGIKGFASLLVQELGDRPDLQKMARHILEGSDNLNEFVTNVLTYARPFEMEIRTVDLIQVIKEIHELLRVDPAWNEQIEWHFLSPFSSFFVNLDLHLFKSACLNLFMNAMQSMPQGGQLTVKLDQDGEWMTLIIQDTGVGIPQEHLPKIFSPFFSTKEKGNGLGLAEVYRVIQAHEGHIEVESQLGVGTIFTIKMRRSSTNDN